MKLLYSILISLLVVTSSVWSAQLRFEEITKVLKVPLDAKKVEVHYNFTVEGDGEVRVAKIIPTCSCMEAEFNEKGKKLWKAGESGSLRVVFSMKRLQGKVNKVTRIRLAGEKRPSIHLRTVLDIPALLRITPQTHKWKLNGPADEKVYDITVVGDEEGAKITQVVTTNGLFEFKLETLEEGKKYRLKASPKSTENQAMALFRITTNSKNEKHEKYQVFALVGSRKKK